MSSLDYGTLDDDDWMKMMQSSSDKYKNLKRSCCRCCVGFTFTLSLTALFLWLSMIPSAPVIYLSYNCYVDATGTGDTTVVYVELNPRNTNMVKEIYYDHFNVSLSYNFDSEYFINLGYNDSASELHQGYPMKYQSQYDEYLPNVTISSESGQLKDDMRNDTRLVYASFDVDVAVTWRIMNRKKGHKMVVRGSFSVERSNYWYLYGNNPAILTIKWPVTYLSTSQN